MKKSTLVWVLALVLLIVGASFGYKTLTRTDSQTQAETDIKDNKDKTEDSGSKQETEEDKNDPTSDKDESKKAPSKNAAPDFTVFNSAGDPVKFSSFEGQPAVINFWASW